MVHQFHIVRSDVITVNRRLEERNPYYFAMRSYRIAQAVIATSVGIILTCHIWLAVFRSDYPTNSEDSGKDQSYTTEGKTLRISQWRQGYLEAIDSRRIVLHETNGRGYLNVRQSCAVESAARHNPDRPVHLFMRRTIKDDKENSSDAWLCVLRHYGNVEVVQISDDILYSNNTALFTWFKTRRRNVERSGHHLADYIRSVTLFKGGGLFLDMDSVVTIKRLIWSKWNNFFVVKRNKKINQRRGGVTVEMLHLLHGHHLIDEIILNIAKADAKEDDGILGAAIDASVNRICGADDLISGWKNQCLDVRLIDEEDVFLPPFDSPFWRSLSEIAITSNKGHDILKKAIENHDAVLMDWDSMTSLNRNLTDPAVYSTLLEQHCPFTLANSKHFSTFYF